MMRTIHLHGALGERFGPEHRLAVDTAAEAVRAMCINHEGFADAIRDGMWRVVMGPSVETGHDLDEDVITNFRLGANDLHIVPVIEGAKKNGLVKLVLGAVLIGISFGFGGAGFLAQPVSQSLFGAATWGNMIGRIGMAMALSGAASLLAPDKKGEEKNQSFMFAGPSNNAEPGSPVPVIYGEVITQGVLISGGVDIDQLEGSGSGSNRFPGLFGKLEGSFYTPVGENQ